MKIGIVPYSNCWPLVAGMETLFERLPPSTLVQRNDLDLMLAPIVCAFLDPNLYLIEGAAIGCLGAVETVKLFFKDSNVTPRNIGNIYLDCESSTSQILLKILLSKYYGRNIDEIQFSESMTHTMEGSLLIGDKVWNQPKNQKQLDLGEIWYSWTRRPFVFACWMSHSKETALKWKPTLLKHKEKNLKDLETVAKSSALKNREKLLRYWRKLIFELDNPQKEAIHFFQKEWSKLENQPVLPLNWV